MAKRKDSGLGEEEIKGVNGSVKVEVKDLDRKDRNKKYAIYKVSVSTEGRQIAVGHRYNEYLTLCNKMKRKYPELQVKLPGKKLFSAVDSEMVETRRVAIQDMFEKLLSYTAVFNSADVQLFFTLRTSRPSSYETDDEAYYSMNPSVQSSRRNSICEELALKEKQNRTKPSDFEFLKVVGNGSFGKVYLARHRTEQKSYAVKVLNKQTVVEKNEARHVMCERQVLVTNTKHPFLVGLHYSFQTTEKLYLVMDYINGGELFFHLQREKRFSETRVRFYAAEISSALGFLHSHKIIYRDLKPENILLDSEGHIALTDFGLCKEGKLTASTFCGTAEYLAPEVLQQKPYDQMVDWWCLGAVMYELLLGLPPFYSRNRQEMFDWTLNKPLQFRLEILTDQAKDLLNKLLTKDKSERLGCHNDVQDIKQHPFFKSIDWELLEQRQIKPPFVPELKEDSLDTSNFDQQFTKIPVSESVTKSSNAPVRSSTTHSTGGATSRVFEDFSYRKAVTPESDDEIFCF